MPQVSTVLLPSGYPKNWHSHSHYSHPLLRCTSEVPTYRSSPLASLPPHPNFLAAHLIFSRPRLSTHPKSPGASSTVFASDWIDHFMDLQDTSRLFPAGAGEWGHQPCARPAPPPSLAIYSRPSSALHPSTLSLLLTRWLHPDAYCTAGCCWLSPKQKNIRTLTAKMAAFSRPLALPHFAFEPARS
jgi:hypothetical protein